MAKRKTLGWKNRPLYERAFPLIGCSLFPAIFVAIVFGLGVWSLSAFLSVFGIPYAYEGVFIGATIPLAVALLYRLMVGKWPNIGD